MKSIRQYSLSLTILAISLSTPLFARAAQTESTANIPAAVQLYKEECASCHMAYPAWLLPSRSWQKIMTGLDNHFGDNASLDAATLKTLSDYLQQNSADVAANRKARKLTRGVSSDNPPMRITELPYFRHEHNEIPSRMITANPGVKSLSNCAACHTGAEKGVFNEHNVRIPGYGRWDD